MAPNILILITGDSPQKTYFPGQIVAGKICFGLDKELDIYRSKFKFSGQAQVDFTKDWSSSKTLYYEAKEFLQYELHIGFKDHRVNLPVGYHEFPFSFSIPIGLPSSYSGKHGRVTYQLCLKSHNEESYYGFPEKQVVLSINGDLDLKKELGAELPVEIAIKDKKICKGTGGGPISLKLTIPKQGFVPGESIKFLVEINNSSKKPVNSVEMTLIQKVDYHGKFKHWSGCGTIIFGYIKNKDTVSVSEVILQQIVPGIAKGDSGKWSPGTSFKIPSILPPTNLAGCKIIDVQYTLHFEATIDLNYKISRDIQIIIGTIPLAPPSYAEANSNKNGNTHGTGDKPSEPAGPI